MLPTTPAPSSSPSFAHGPSPEADSATSKRRSGLRPSDDAELRPLGFDDDLKGKPELLKLGNQIRSPLPAIRPKFHDLQCLLQHFENSNRSSGAVPVQCLGNCDLAREPFNADKKGGACPGLYCSARVGRRFFRAAFFIAGDWASASMRSRFNMRVGQLGFIEIELRVFCNPQFVRSDVH